MSAKELTPPAYSVREGEVRTGSEPVSGTEGSGRDAAQNDRWLDSLESLLGDVVRKKGPEQVDFLLAQLVARIRDRQRDDSALSTPYVNTIAREDEPRYPGDRRIERQVKSYVRWNAMAMVVKANRLHSGIGGHISTYASAANLYEVGFNHFFRGGDGETPGDLVYFQGHASPGNYARAYLEHRLSARKLHLFRQELAKGGGLPSYPHPHLMPDFWQFPSVSMGLAPIMSIYQARFARYLAARGLLSREPRVWCFLGDGETDEPESTGALSLASRENLDNLVWVVNCNLQRLD
ncbi:MAG: pyruvate dehydrogenase (acetyl-transferring), homodimeric type, partial [Deltaproteobacteria bacterium]|nr:pyruvate dehydrogenase (acetyl-transferring), homodimeric type [Deltaproteobacteria bacterium]